MSSVQDPEAAADSRRQLQMSSNVQEAAADELAVVVTATLVSSEAARGDGSVG
jgi:hypothetical protein